MLLVLMLLLLRTVFLGGLLQGEGSVRKKKWVRRRSIFFFSFFRRGQRFFCALSFRPPAPSLFQVGFSFSRLLPDVHLLFLVTRSLPLTCSKRFAVSRDRMERERGGGASEKTMALSPASSSSMQEALMMPPRKRARERASRSPLPPGGETRRYTGREAGAPEGAALAPSHTTEGGKGVFLKSISGRVECADDERGRKKKISLLKLARG